MSINRRGFMQIGALALGGLTLEDVLAARRKSNKTPSTSVIMLYQHGGASQFETYDMKPDAPTAIKSQFRAIPTNVPGMDICEHFPLQAKIAHRFSLIRSLHHDASSHSDGGIVVLTGKRPIKLDPTSTSKSDHPDFGSIASQYRGMRDVALPPYVAIPTAPYMTRPAYLGLHHAAFKTGDPSSKSFRVPQLKLNVGKDTRLLSDRRNLLGQLDRIRASIDSHGNMSGTDEIRELAFQMLTSPQAVKAFDLSQEDDDLRKRYGYNTWGQGCLLARRLAESGVAVINLYFNTPKSGPEFTNWDDHPGNATRPGHFAKYMKVRLPYMDQALAALINDIYDRSLNRRILVVVVGEFGRTPRMRYGPPNRSYGRDHWPAAYSALVSGGGLNMGQIVGATNRLGEYPSQRPYTPQDLLATVYRHLGINYKETLNDFSGRPVHILNKAKHIREL